MLQKLAKGSLVLRIEVVDEGPEVTRVKGEESLNKGFSRLGETGFDDPAVKVGSLPVYEALLLKAIHDVGHVPPGDKELFGEFPE
jgi:hypothetical protein